MSNPQESEESREQGVIDRSKRNIKKPRRFIQEDEDDQSDDSGMGPSQKTKKQPKKSKKKSEKKKKKNKDTKSKSKSKKGKKEKRVARSKVLTKKNRPISSKKLDKFLMARLGANNSFFSQNCHGSGGGQQLPLPKLPSLDLSPVEQHQKRATPTAIAHPRSPPVTENTAQSDQIMPRDIAPNLGSAIRDGQKYYIAGTQIKAVPKQFLRKQSQESATVRERNEEASKHDLENAQTPSAESAEKSNVNEGESVTFEGIVARIPDHILRSRNRGTQAMYVLRLMYTREQIAKSSVTGTKSEFPSFIDNFGPYLFSLYKRVLMEKFGIFASEIATLISKRINYVRNSPKILRVARIKRQEKKTAQAAAEADVDPIISSDNHDIGDEDGNNDKEPEIQNENYTDLCSKLSSSDDSEETDESDDDASSQDDSEDETEGSGASETAQSEDDSDSDEDKMPSRKRQ